MTTKIVKMWDSSNEEVSYIKQICNKNGIRLRETNAIILSGDSGAYRLRGKLHRHNIKPLADKIRDISQIFGAIEMGKTLNLSLEETFNKIDRENIEFHHEGDLLDNFHIKPLPKETHDNLHRQKVLEEMKKGQEVN